MANTANDFVRDVAQEIGFLGEGEELDDASNSRLKTRSGQIHEQLRQEGYCSWDEDDIPGRVYFPLVRYMAACCGRLFGFSVRDEPLGEAQTMEARKAALIRVASFRYTGSKAEGTYF